MFKFDFKISNTDHIESSDPDLTSDFLRCTADHIGNSDSDSEPHETSDKNCYDSEEIQINQNHLENIGLYKLSSSSIKIGDLKLRYLKSDFILKSLENTSKDGTEIKEAEIHHSDLLPGIYEGGAKIWECTEDVLYYLHKKYTNNYFYNKAILDLGCGCGLLGLFCIKSNSNCIHFQDYNKDVLENITIPNMLINAPESWLKNMEHYNIKFYSGDWTNYVNLTRSNEKFDIILTSETIYNTNNQVKLLNTFDSKLKSNGMVLLAAKVYYFGVGGGIREFENLLLKDGRFTSKVVWNSSYGVGREILEIRRKLLTS